VEILFRCKTIHGEDKQRNKTRSIPKEEKRKGKDEEEKNRGKPWSDCEMITHDKDP